MLLKDDLRREEKKKASDGGCVSHLVEALLRSLSLGEFPLLAPEPAPLEEEPVGHAAEDPLSAALHALKPEKSLTHLASAFTTALYVFILSPPEYVEN